MQWTTLWTTNHSHPLKEMRTYIYSLFLYHNVRKYTVNFFHLNLYILRHCNENYIRRWRPMYVCMYVRITYSFNTAITKNVPTVPAMYMIGCGASTTRKKCRVTSRTANHRAQRVSLPTKPNLSPFGQRLSKWFFLTVGQIIVQSQTLRFIN